MPKFKLNKKTHSTVSQQFVTPCIENCLLLGLIKGSCVFALADFPTENPRKQKRNYPYIITLYAMAAIALKNLTEASVWIMLDQD